MAVKKENRVTEETDEGMAVEKKTEETCEGKRSGSPDAEPRKMAEKVTMVYIGPSLPAGWLKSNRVFTGTMQEIENELETVFEKYPAAKKLLVPVGQLAEKKQKSRTPGNILNKYYADIVSDIAAHAREV